MTTTTVDTGRVRELERALTETKSALDGMTASWKTEEGGGLVLSTEQHADYLNAVGRAEQIKSLIDAEHRLGGIFGVPGEVKGLTTHEDGGVGEVREPLSRMEVKSLAEMFMESEPYQEMKALRLDHTNRPFVLNARDIGRRGYGVSEAKDIYTAKGGNFTVPAFGSQQNDGIIIPAYRTVRIRDLFPSAGTTASSIEYVRRTGYVNAARVVPERTAADGTAATGGPTDVFGLKPPSNLTYTPQVAPVVTIAHTIDVSRTILADEPRLQDTINGEMLYGLRLAEDAELLQGAGAGHITGILNTAGLQVYHQSDRVTPTGGIADTKVDAVRRAATRVMLAYYEPTGVVFHPFDWEDLELTKNAQGSYVLVVSVAVGAQKTVWGLQVVATPAMPQGQFLSGAFGLGAKLYDREEATIAISTETRDLFDRNAIAIRAEERLALEVGRPESFVNGFFS